MSTSNGESGPPVVKDAARGSFESAADELDFEAEDVFAQLTADDGTSGLEDLSGSDSDELGPSGAAEAPLRRGDTSTAELPPVGPVSPAAPRHMGELGPDAHVADLLGRERLDEALRRSRPATDSHAPPPSLIPSSIPPSIWPDERPARDHVDRQRETWVERAEWLESEARGASDPLAKARSLLVASELWALLGELSRAREVAAEAAAIPRATPMAARQLRALAAADGDFKAVVPALELEIRGAATADARVHAAYLSAEVHRLALRDNFTAKKKLEIAIRAKQDDPRAHVAKLVDLLGHSNAPARMRFPESPDLAELAHASDELSHLRGRAIGSGSEPLEGPRSAFDEARRALSEGDLENAVAALAKLAQVESLGPACAWLSICLLSVEPSTRPRAQGLLDRLARSGSRLAYRARLAGALGRDEAEVVRRAVLQQDGDGDLATAISTADRVALATLAGVHARSLDAAVWELANDVRLRPLAAAWVGAGPAATLDVRAGTDESRAEQNLGERLASPPSDWAGLAYLRADAESFRETHPDHPLTTLLALEFAKANSLSASIARALAEWPSATGRMESERDRALAAGFVYELASDPGAAATEYARALQHDGASEAALRALSNDAPSQTADRLVALAERLDDSPRAALPLLEAALRKGTEDPDGVSLLVRAQIADPGFPLSYRLSEVAARQSGDREALLATLRARRLASTDSIECSLDLVREALLVAETDLGLADELLTQALRARPTDLALRELYERVVQTDDPARAAWREQLAEISPPPLKRRLFAEAALERGRAGDLETAAQNAYRAAEGSQGGLSAIAAERYLSSGRALEPLVNSLLQRARESEHQTEQRELYERLSELQGSRGDRSGLVSLQKLILAQLPEHLPTLQRLEQTAFGGADPEALEPITALLARLLDPGEAVAHARLAARFSARRADGTLACEFAEIALRHDPDSTWALRLLSAQGRLSEDHELALRADQRLFELAERPLDKATLAVRAAEAALHLGRLSDAKRLLHSALELMPDHWVALSTLADTLEASSEYGAAAQALENLAHRSAVPAHQADAWHRAAVLWLDKLGDAENGLRALESCITIDLGHEDALARLQSLYVAAGDRYRLAELLERRLERTSDPEERVAIEVARARALTAVGERDEAKAALSAALDANPDHADALAAFAALCFDEGDWQSAEQAFIRLARHVLEPEKQAQVYRRLAELYDTALPNPERAALAYGEVLKRDPDDASTVERLILVHSRMGDTRAALALQVDLLARARTPEEKRDRTLALAIVEEQIVGDRKRAETTFDKARKEWPHDSVVLRALVHFQQRGGETRASQMLLDRAANDARRALATGRFEPVFFEILATVSELRNAGDAATVTRSTLAALHGEDLAVHGAGLLSGDARLDDLLAPELVSPPLRALLRKSGAVLDAAYALDLLALRAEPLPPSGAPFTSYVQQVGAAFGLRDIEVLASPTIGPVCMPVSAQPPRILFGQALLDSSDDAARYFLLIRCLKILQANAAALSRTSAIDLWPVIAAYLGMFASNWQPPGVDAKKFAEAQKRIQACMNRRLDDDVAVLALEVIGSIGNRATLMGTAIHQWGSRAALLSAGSLVASLRGIALSGGHTSGPPSEGAERVKWIVRNPEARDLATFSIGEQYLEARARLGL